MEFEIVCTPEWCKDAAQKKRKEKEGVNEKNDDCYTITGKGSRGNVMVD